MRHRMAAAAMAALLAGTALSGCGGDEKAAAKPTGTVLIPGKPGEPNRTGAPKPVTSATPTAAEVRFMQMMIPHHEQALSMSVLAPGQAGDGQVKGLAKRIELAQGVEIPAMQSWLKQKAPKARNPHAGHGKPAPTATDTHANMPGMATPQQMEQLRAARGGAFDRLYLELMIVHHQGALTMVRDVLDKGTDVTVQELARDVMSGQNAEIGRMQGMLKTLKG